MALYDTRSQGLDTKPAIVIARCAGVRAGHRLSLGLLCRSLSSKSFQGLLKNSDRRGMGYAVSVRTVEPRLLAS